MLSESVYRVILVHTNRLKLIEIEHNNASTRSMESIQWAINKPQSMGALAAYLFFSPLQKIHRYLQANHCIPLLSIGCGEGAEAEYFKRRKFEVVGLDISLGMLRCARIRSKKRNLDLMLVRGDAESLPFRDDAFNVAMFNNSLHHLVDVNRGFSEAARISKEYVVISEPVKVMIFSPLLRFFNLLQYEYTGRRMRRFEINELSCLCKNHGLEMEGFEREFNWAPQMILKICGARRIFLLLFKKLYKILNKTVGRFGNCIIAIYRKN